MAPLGDVVRKRARWATSVGEKTLYRFGILKTNKLVLPNFLGIGAMKAGTTWLYENLYQHPGIFMSRQKELHFFDWHWERPLTWYSRQFSAGRRKVKGEISPSYCVLPPRRIHFIKTLMPQIKLIYMMRNPVERAWSHAVMNLMRDQGRRFEEVPDDEIYAHLTSRHNRERNEYLEHLALWSSFFPTRQIFYGFNDDLKTRPKEFLEDVFRFLGVSTDVDWSKFPYQSVVFQGIGVQIPPRFKHFLEVLYRREIDIMIARFGDRIESWRVRD